MLDKSLTKKIQREYTLQELPVDRHVYIQSLHTILRSLGADEIALKSVIALEQFLLGIVTLDQIEHDLGEFVRSIVSNVHLLLKASRTSKRLKIERQRMMIVKAAQDIRVLLIVFADRIIRLSSNDVHSELKQLAHDALDLFAPAAARLGMYALKHKVEEAAFPIAYSSDAENIQHQLANVSQALSQIKVIEQFLQNLLKESGIKASVRSRMKQSFSIFRKLQEKGLSHVTELLDLIAFRVVIDGKDEQCYRVLGIIHAHGIPMPNRFKDYVAFPKPNGYRSIHTTLKQFEHIEIPFPLEIQIRTQTMHDEAEYGVAAHWNYKEGGEVRHQKQRSLLQGLLASQQALTQPLTQEVRYSDHMYVLTPTGDIVELPEGATPLDFAFLVHTDVGLSYKNAKVNGVIVPVSYHLENGDIVEINRHREPKPSPRWLDILKVSSARQRLKRFLLDRDRPGLFTRGRDLVQAELKRRALPPLDQDLSVLREYLGKRLTMAEREDVLISIAQGAQSVTSFISLLIPKDRIVQPALVSNIGQKQLKVQLDNGLNMPLKFAKCCKPNERQIQEIKGVISRSSDVRIHSAHCAMLKNANPERICNATWIESKK